jgi:hypothetical protein
MASNDLLEAADTVSVTRFKNTANIGIDAHTRAGPVP